MKTLKDYLNEIAKARPNALAYIESNGFRFTTQLNKPDLTDAERWEKLAFSLYTDLAEVSEKAEAALAALMADVPDQMVDDAEWQRRHS